jgi:hypothetical protein
MTTDAARSIQALFRCIGEPCTLYVQNLVAERVWVSMRSKGPGANRYDDWCAEEGEDEENLLTSIITHT